MTKFEKLQEAIQDLFKKSEIQEINESGKKKAELLRYVQDIKMDVHFNFHTDTDMRFKEKKKAIVEDLEDLEDMIIKGRFHD